MTLDSAGILNRLGLLFFLCINTAFGVIMPIVTQIPLEKVITKHERASGAYRPSSAFLARYLSSLPVSYLGISMLIIPVYFMAGLQVGCLRCAACLRLGHVPASWSFSISNAPPRTQNDATHFFTYYCILFVHINVGIAFATMIGSWVSTPEMAQIVTPFAIVLQLLFGGQFLNLDAISWALKWIQYVSFITYTNKALAQNEFRGLKFECTSQEECIPDGETVLSNNFLDSLAMWSCVGVNAGLAGFYLIVAFIVFKRATKPTQRLI
jgi:hypothetical protein